MTDRELIDHVMYRHQWNLAMTPETARRLHDRDHASPVGWKGHRHDDQPPTYQSDRLGRRVTIPEDTDG